MEPKIDRRIRRTRKMLTEAFMALILEKGYDKVTVQDIIDRANVGRSTFYVHYENKEQLLLDGPNNLDVPFLNDMENPGGVDFDAFFQHIHENSGLAKAMLGSSGGGFMNHFVESKLAALLERKFRESENLTGNHLLRYRCKAMSAAIVTLLENWVENEFDLTVFKISELAREMINLQFDSERKC